MSGNKERDSVVDFLMTMAFVAVMLIVVRAKARIDDAKKLEKEQQKAEAVTNELDCIPKD